MKTEGTGIRAPRQLADAVSGRIPGKSVGVEGTRWVQAVAAYGIGTMAAFWFLQRAVLLM